MNATAGSYKSTSARALRLCGPRRHFGLEAAEQVVTWRGSLERDRRLVTRQGVEQRPCGAEAGLRGRKRPMPVDQGLLIAFVRPELSRVCAQFAILGSSSRNLVEARSHVAVVAIGLVL
jgi:hypothetical protein